MVANAAAAARVRNSRHQAKRSAMDVLFRKFGSEASKTADGYDNELENYGMEDPRDIEKLVERIS